MSAPIGPGDLVEVCGGSGLILARGTIVQVGEIRHGGRWSCVSDALCDMGIRLVRGPNPEDGRFWCSCQFRPIYRPKTTFIDSLQQPAPERELQEA